MPRFVSAMLLRTMPTALAFTAAACVSFPEVTGGEGGGASTASSSAGGGSSSSLSSAGGAGSTSASGGGGEGGAGGLGECYRTGAECLQLGAFGGDLDGLGGGVAQMTVAYDGEDLVLAPQDGRAWWSTMQGMFVHAPVTGDFVALGRLEVQTPGSDMSGAVFEVGGLLVRDPDQPKWMKFEVGRTSPLSYGVAPRLLLAWQDGTNSEHLGGPEPYYVELGDTPAPFATWLAVCRSSGGSTLEFHYRVDTVGSPWTPHAATPVPGTSTGATVGSRLAEFGGTLEVGMIAGDYLDDEPDVVVRFSHFSILPLAPANSCADALPDEDDLPALAPHCGFCAP